jgi:hypothetical protein
MQDTIHKQRALVSILSGISCGILGLESLNGILFYGLISVVYTCLLYARQPTVQLDVPIATFILFWVFSYGVVHVY